MMHIMPLSCLKERGNRGRNSFLTTFTISISTRRAVCMSVCVWGGRTGAQTWGHWLYLLQISLVVWQLCCNQSHLNEWRQSRTSVVQKASSFFFVVLLSHFKNNHWFLQNCYTCSWGIIFVRPCFHMITNLISTYSNKSCFSHSLDFIFSQEMCICIRKA